MGKAQVSIEFLTYSIMFLVAMGSMLTIIVILGNEQVQLQKYEVVKQFTKDIATAIVFTYSMGNDFSYSFKVDKTLNGKPYQIILLEKSYEANILVESGDFSYSILMPSLSFEAGNNVIKNGNLYILKSEDMVLGHIILEHNSGNKIRVSLE